MFNTCLPAYWSFIPVGVLLAAIIIFIISSWVNDDYPPQRK